MQALIDHLCDAFEKAQRDNPSKRAESPQLQRERLQLVLEQSVEHFQSQWQVGEKAFREHVDQALYERIFPPLFERFMAERSDTLESLSAADQQWLAELCSDTDFGQLLAVAHRRLLSGDHETAAAMYAVLLSFRPDDCRIYIGLATVLWETQGVLAAAQLYEVLTRAWDHPELGYFGAECMRVAGWHDRALVLIEQSIRSLHAWIADGEETESIQTLREEMEQLRDQLESEC